MKILTGHDAILYARDHREVKLRKGVGLGDGAREVTLDEAHEIVRLIPSLVTCEVPCADYVARIVEHSLLGMLVVPECLTVERRRPAKGEAGWYVTRGASIEACVDDVVRGRDLEETTPGSYGWLAEGTEPASQWHSQFGILELVTVIYKPTRHTVTITLEMEGRREDVDRAVAEALDSGAIQAQILEADEDLDGFEPYAIVEARHEVRS